MNYALVLVNIKGLGVKTFSYLIPDDIKEKIKIGQAVLVPFVRIIEPENEERSPFLFVAGSAVFKEDKMVGLLDEEQTRGILWITDKVSDGIVALDFNGIDISLEILDSKGKFDAKYSDGKIIVKSKAEVVFSLGEYQGAGWFDEETIEKMKTMAEDKIKKEIKEAFGKVQEKGADVFGIGNYFYRFDYKKWQGFKEDFEELYKNAEIQADVDVQIIRTGSLLEPIEANNGGNNE